MCFRQCIVVSRCSEPLKAWQYIGLLADWQAADEIVVRACGMGLRNMFV